MTANRQERVLTLRELNRATLARQLLLDRSALPIPQAVEQIAGLQAQAAMGPHIGLWSRLRDFHREDLNRLLERRQLVKATLMRATLHIVTAQDYQRFRSTLQPALTSSLRSVLSRTSGLDLDRLVEAARRYFEEKPRSFAELRGLLADLEPDRDLISLAYAVRTHLPLVQIPNGSDWGFSGNPDFTTVEAWLGRPLTAADELRSLVFRYLGAFGPATVQDLRTWSGLSGLKDKLDDIKRELQSFRDERGRELLDLPDRPLPPGDTPAPPRFLPQYDNLLLSHADRTRVLADIHRPGVFVAPQIRATILVDGFVRGVWRLGRARHAVTLVIEPFEQLPPGVRAALAEEGGRLLRFLEGSTENLDVRIEEPRF